MTKQNQKMDKLVKRAAQIEKSACSIMQHKDFPAPELACSAAKALVRDIDLLKDGKSIRTSKLIDDITKVNIYANEILDERFVDQHIIDPAADTVTYGEMLKETIKGM